MPAQVWKEVYETLLQERDRSKLPMRCDQAEQAINERFRELLEKPTDGHFIILCSLGGKHMIRRGTIHGAQTQGSAYATRVSSNPT